MITVVLVDDRPLVRVGLERVLSQEQGFTVVAHCADGAEAVTAIRKASADVVLMDVRMRGVDGIEARGANIMDLGTPTMSLSEHRAARSLDGWGGNSCRWKLRGQEE